VTAGSEGIEVRDLKVSFGGVHALTDVSITIPPGRVHGIIGPNGSGKTTLLNALSGFVRVSGGLYLDGQEITRMAAHRRAARGLGRTFQNPRGDHTLTVREVMRLGEHLRRLQPWWMVALAPRLADRAWEESNARACAFLAQVGLDESVLDSRLIDLPSGVMKMVDIGRALLGEPRVLLLDEPTSGMNEGEIEQLREVLNSIKTEDVTIVLVEHNLRFVSRTCETVTVLDGGRVLGEGVLDEVLANPDVVRAYIGESKVALAGVAQHGGTQGSPTSARPRS
jgi:branched-chain amino acid transport system ATP-binding protein